MINLPSDLLMLNEKLQNMNHQFLADKNSLKKETESKSDKLKMIYVKLDTFK